jgi:hypothetical protein
MEITMDDTPPSRWVAWAGPEAAASVGKTTMEAAWDEHTHKADLMTPPFGAPPTMLLADGSLWGFGCVVAHDYEIAAPDGMVEINSAVATGVLGR